MTNSTLSFEPAWQTYASILTFGMGVIMYSCFSIAAIVIIIGRNIIPSLCCCCLRVKVTPTVFKEDETSILGKREVPVLSLFFLFFLFYNIYSVGTCLAMAMGYVGRILDQEHCISDIIITVFHVLYYGSFLLFYVYSCFYVILLMNVASVWFHVIDFGGTKKKKIFQGIISSLVGLMMFIALLCIIVIDSCIFFRITNRSAWTVVLLITASINVCCHAILSFLSISLILFTIIMIARFGDNSSNSDRLSKLKIYSLKLIIAVGMLFLANTFRLTSLILLGMQIVGVPSFISSPLLGLVIPDFLDMSVCIIVYWPFKLCCFDLGNSAWQQIINPINFNALYNTNNSNNKEIEKESTKTIKDFTAPVVLKVPEVKTVEIPTNVTYNSTQEPMQDTILQT